MLNLEVSQKILDYCKSKKYPIGNFNIIYLEDLFRGYEH